MDSLRHWTAKIALVMAFVAIAPLWAGAELDAAEHDRFGKRFALIIGNSDYEHAPRLPNAVRDASRIAEELAALRFEVFKGTDLGKAEFERLVRDFRGASKGADAVVFYYAGHGFQLNGLNHLVPTDAVMKDRSLIHSETLVIDSILASIHGPQRQTMVFLDACRNNPLPPELRDESTLDGLAQLKAGDDGIFIAFATQPGNTSRDGAGLHSPFTSALLRHIGDPGQTVSSLMIKVRNDVARATLNQQLPWDQSSLRAEFHFNPVSEAPVAVAGVAGNGYAAGAEDFHTGSTSRATTEDEQQPTFVLRPPSGVRMEDSSSGSGQGTKMAAIDPSRPHALAVPDAGATTGMFDERELTVEIQRHLNRLGCNAGSADGVWGPATSRSVEAFNRHAGASIDSSGPAMESFDVLRRHSGAICPKACGRGTVEKDGVCVAVAPSQKTPARKEKSRAEAKPQQSEPQTTIGSGIGVGSFF